MPKRTQTLVQLNEELVARLDRRASRLGVSRSRLIRELLELSLTDETRSERTRRMIEGYERAPQAEARDEWGDLDAWTETNVRRNLAALSAEEEEPW